MGYYPRKAFGEVIFTQYSHNEKERGGMEGERKRERKKERSTYVL